MFISAKTRRMQREQSGMLNERIDKTIKNIQKNRALFLALHYQAATLLVFLEKNPLFSAAIVNYEKSFLEKKFHQDIVLQRALTICLRVENNIDALTFYLSSNLKVLNFFEQALPLLIDAAQEWQLYIDYDYDKDKLSSLKTQLTHGFGHLSINNYVFPRVEPFAILKAFLLMNERLVQLNRMEKHTIDYHHAINCELFYLNHLQAYCRIKLRTNLFENQRCPGKYRLLINLEDMTIDLEVVEKKFISLLTINACVSSQDRLDKFAIADDITGSCQAIDRELMYINYLQCYCQTQLKTNKLNINNPDLPTVYYKFIATDLLEKTIIELNRLKEKFTHLKAKSFIKTLKYYIYHQNWAVDYQLVGKFIDKTQTTSSSKAIKQRIPSHVGIQLTSIQQACNGKITYIAARDEVNTIGLAASRQNNRSMFRFFATRSPHTKAYYDLFKPEHEKTLLKNIDNTFKNTIDYQKNLENTGSHGCR